MTFQHPERPDEAAQNPLTEATPTRPITPHLTPSGEVIRHILVGSPEAIRETIYRLHMLRYVEQAQWTEPIKLGSSGIHINPDQGQMLAYLMRLRALDLPAG